MEPSERNTFWVRNTLIIPRLWTLLIYSLNILRVIIKNVLILIYDGLQNGRPDISVGQAKIVTQHSMSSHSFVNFVHLHNIYNRCKHSDCKTRGMILIFLFPSIIEIFVATLFRLTRNLFKLLLTHFKGCFVAGVHVLHQLLLVYHLSCNRKRYHNVIFSYLQRIQHVLKLRINNVLLKWNVKFSISTSICYFCRLILDYH